jgi:tRNA threonylcarbamoyladenosine biosynthesis protein TsaE
MTTDPARLAEKVGSAVAWETTSAAETHALGKAVGEACAGHAVMALVGPLGAGKTCLVRGIAEGLGVPTDLVASPTFVLIHEYTGRLPLYHADLYRLEEQDAVNGLGLEEYTESPGVTVIEWADKAPGVLPRDHLWITLDHLGGDRRRVALHPRGARSAELVARATARLAKQSRTGRA